MSKHKVKVEVEFDVLLARSNHRFYLYVIDLGDQSPRPIQTFCWYNGEDVWYPCTLGSTPTPYTPATKLDFLLDTGVSL